MSESSKAYKASRGVAYTNSQLSLAQEPFDRSLRAREVLKDFTGSWTSSFLDGDGVSLDNAATVTGVRSNTWRVGQPGVPEVNFVPYNWGTNRAGLKKGPSLLGHPISLSVVGPTLKTLCEWQWSVTDNSATPGTGDLLTLDTAEGILSVIGQIPPRNVTVADIYNFLPLGDYLGGLYLFVSQTGEPAEVDSTSGQGLGDGFISDVLSAGKTAIVAKNRVSKFEIFRVVEINATSIRLDPSKRLATYFTFPGGGTPMLRAVTFFQPHVTQLVGLGTPGSETAFVVVPPAQVAAHEYYPVYNGSGGWVTGGFDTDDLVLMGSNTTWADRPHTPIPRPQDSNRIYRLTVQKASGASLAVDAGLSVLVAEGWVPSISHVGKILKVFDVKQTGDAPLPTDPERLLGFYEVHGISGQRVVIKRTPEVDPITGHVFWGSWRSLELDDSVFAGDIQIQATLHDPVSDLHSESWLDFKKLNAARLTNLIDPVWFHASAKGANSSGAKFGRLDAHGNRPQKAIWDTTSSNAGAAGSNSNPGSLLDLGFRMVLFPAKAGAGTYAGQVVPDFDRPFTGPQVVLDPNETESQSIDIDYVSGVVTLSHIPVPGAGCTIAPNGVIAGSNNGRSGIVLFASCVPFSLEKTGEGPLVGAVTTSPDGSKSFETGALGPRVSFPVMYEVEGIAQQIVSGTNQVIDLDAPDLTDLPPSGFIEFRQGSIFGPPLFEGPNGENLSIYGYSVAGMITDGVSGVTHPRLYGCWGGADSNIPDTHVVTSTTDVVAVLRRDLLSPMDSDGIAGVPWEFDSQYGFVSPSRIVFEGLNVTPQWDGSIKVGLDPIEAGKVLSSGNIINVKAYGALGDGVTDDTVAIQSAFDAANDGYIIQFPRGIYVVSSTLTLSKGVFIQGVSSPPTTTTSEIFGHADWANSAEYGVFLQTSMTTGRILEVDTTGYKGRVKIINLGFKGIGNNTRTTGGVHLGGATGINASLENVVFANFKVGLSTQGATNGEWVGIHCRGCETGLSLDSASSNNAIVGALTDDCTYGATVSGEANTFVGGNVTSFPNVDGGAASTITNVAAETAFTCKAEFRPSVVDDWIKFSAQVTLTVNPGEGARLRLKAAPLSASLTAGTTLVTADIADSGVITFEGWMNITAIGMAGTFDYDLVVKTGGAIPAVVLPEIGIGSSLDLSGAWHLGLTLEDNPNWTIASTATLRYFKASRVNGILG